MEDIIQRLEARIHQLMQQCNALNQDKEQLLREKEALLAKHNMAILQIENMVSRLKSVENSQ